MSCPACGHENRAGRKFCAECGAALALACAACSAPYEAGEKFCGECGAELGTVAPRPAAGGGKESLTRAATVPGAAADADARKVVTIVFADLVGSTALHERLDAESARRVMERYYAALRIVVDAHGGAVVKLLGDGVMAAFGLKQVAEDDALRAVRAAAAMQDAYRALVDSEAAALGAAGLRVAVNTGEVVVSGARDDVIGDPVNVAARLQEQGHDGDVVIGEATRRLVATRVTLAPLGSVRLKGRAEAVAAYRLVSLDPPAGTTAAPFVGRATELAQLETVYGAAVTTPATRLAVLLGSPGLGKSRLIDELGRRHGDAATILSAHCDAAGGGTFAPLAQALRGFFGLDDGATGEPVRAAVATALAGSDDTERTRIAGGIAGLLGDAVTSPEETFFVVRRFLAGLAAARPVVLVIDDLHWAEPLLLDLVEHLVQWGSGVPLFVLVGARPELRDLRSSLVTPGALAADVVTLGGLDAGAAMRLAANVIGAADLPAAVAAKVLATSEGNPLFVGELVRMLVQEGALTKDGDRWIVGAGLAALEMPPTIHALLAARIERLRPEERHVLERAAVVGRHFSRSAVAALIGRNGNELDARLESLRRSELIERDTGWLLGEPVLRFHHVLIRDAAYRRLLKGTRAELHTRLADWIEGRVGDAPEHDEMVGWHLEQAHQHLRELGPLDATAVALGERAARRLSAAGKRALARDDVALAASLLGRALDRLAPDVPERADLVLDWCEALLSAGDVGPAAAAIAELDRVAAESPRLRAWHTCFAGQLAVLTAPEALHTASEQVGAAARDLAALEDAAGEAKAHFVHAQALARLGKVGACEAALDLALAAARRAGDRRRANAVLAGAPLAALWGPSPVTRASGRCLDVVRVLRITQGAPAVEAVALSCQGVLEALRGRTDAARRMLASSRTMVEELGIAHRLFETDVFAGRVDLLEGNAPAAERALRAGYEGLRQLGLGIDAARAAALLGRALLAQDRAAEAETLSHESELLAGDDLQAAIAWRGVRAEALARRGEPAAAIELAEAAVAIAAATDALLDHADARLALAAAMRAAGRRAEADAEERRAFALWEAKGATVLADQARQRDGAVAPVASSAESHAAASPARRAVRENAATRAGAELEAICAARDVAALATFFADDAQCIDHPSGTTYDGEGMRRGIMRLLQSPEARLTCIPLATLGSSWALVRREMSAGAAVGAHFDVGPYESVDVAIFGANEKGRLRFVEMFALDRLGTALLGLYERYADGLPAGVERERAAAMARTVAATMTPMEVERLVAVLAPEVENVDHRTISTWSARGPEAIGAQMRALVDLATDLAFNVDEILRLTRDAMLLRRIHRGTDRKSGGAYEREFLQLILTNAEGLCARVEWFDVDHEADALARFDALTRGPMARSARRVRPNAATATAARMNALIEAGDAEALLPLQSDEFEFVHHPTGLVLNGEQNRAWWRAGLAEDRDFVFQSEPLATLGDSLGLLRATRSASASRGALDLGAYEAEAISVVEVDAEGRARRVEMFAADHLRPALTRLYERYAESLPEGPARRRASGAARAVATFDGPLDADRIAGGTALSFECVDHRTLGTWSAKGREGWRTHWQGQAELAAAITLRDDDVLALEPGGFVFRQTFVGTSRAGGGAFENVVISVGTFDADGLITRAELFEPDQEAAALACFETVAARTAEKPAVHRHVRPNAATHGLERMAGVIAARDHEALGRIFADALVVVHDPTRATYGRRHMLSTWRSIIKARHLEFRPEILASLGDRLALERHFLAIEGLAEAHVAEFGRSEFDEIALVEADEHGCWLHCEVFAIEQLQKAVARLYERYAESLPDGPERQRAAVTARAVAFMLLPGDDDIDALYAPTYEDIDHRSVGYGAVSRGDAEKLRSSWNEVADDTRFRVDDVLALGPSGLVRTVTTTGVWRDGGGAFERTVCTFNVFDSDGRVARHETFEADRIAEALARFDALTASSAPQRRIERRVRPNAAARACAAIEAAFQRRDVAAIDALLADPMTTIEHPTGTTYGREGQLQSSRWMMRLPDLDVRMELLATLGDSLSLGRRTVTASGAAPGARFDVGEFEFETIVLNETDAAGRLTAGEVFASDRLLQAIARLHARWADILPEGLERTRSVGIACSVSAFEGLLDADRLVSAYAPSHVSLDHRSLGTWSSEGQEEVLRHFRAQAELAADFSRRVDDILAFAPDAILARETWFGTNRATGGPFENVVLVVTLYGANGLLTRSELFEPHQEATALARFDALTSGVEPKRTEHRPVRPNAATATIAALNSAFVGRDLEAAKAMLAAAYQELDHGTGATLDREGVLASFRSLMRCRDPEYRHEPLASLGDRLVLTRRSCAAAASVGGGFDVGPFETEHVVLVETDQHGPALRVEVFASDHLADAIVRLYARWAEILPEGPERIRAAAIARSHAAWTGPIEPERLVSVSAASFACIDHRSLATWSSEGLEEWRQQLRAQAELTEGFIGRDDDILAFAPDVFVGRHTYFGTDRTTGGLFENVFLAVHVFGVDGLYTRYELFEPDQEAAALARYDALSRDDAQALAPSESPFANVATRTSDRMMADWRARDWDGFARMLSAGFRFDDRRSMSQLVLDREGYVAFCRELGDMTSTRIGAHYLATRGERLFLEEVRITVAGGDVGPSDLDHLYVAEIDERGTVMAAVAFDTADLDAAYAELDARFEAGEAAAHARAWATCWAVADAINVRDMDALIAAFTPGYVGEDHRRLQWGTMLSDPAVSVRSQQLLVEMAPDFRVRLDHVRLSERGVLAEAVEYGTRDGGAFETRYLWVVEVDAAGRVPRFDFYDLEQLDQARARFAALAAS